MLLWRKTTAEPMWISQKRWRAAFLPPGRASRLFSSLPGPAAAPWGSASWQGWTRRCAAPPWAYSSGRRRPAGAGLAPPRWMPAGVWVRHAGASQRLAERLGGQRPGPGAVPPRRLPGGRPPPGRLALARKAVRPCVYEPSGRGIFRPAESGRGRGVQAVRRPG